MSTQTRFLIALAKTCDELCRDLKSITLLNNWYSLLFLVNVWEGWTTPTNKTTILTFVDAVTCQHKLEFCCTCKSCDELCGDLKSVTLLDNWSSL